MDRVRFDAVFGADAEKPTVRVEFGMVSVEVPVLTVRGVGVMERQPRPADCAGAVIREGGICEKLPTPGM